ncbi:MAG: SurA N-terminal domain-containing protein [Pseudolabrys sp.]
MPRTSFNPDLFRRAVIAVAAAVILAGVVVAAPARAQVVVVANGSPITELDIQQRTRLIATSSQKAPSRQQVIQELIDDRLKIAKGRVYGLEVSDTEVDNAFQGMASRQRISTQQFSQMLERAGISANAVKARIRAELTWNALIRGKYSSTLQVGESDVLRALNAADANASANAVGHIYTLYPVTVVIPGGSGDGVVQARRQLAENLRSRFQTCNEGLALARSLRDVAVREAVTRSSADLPPQLRELLGNMEIGRLTAPELTPNGITMFALCAKKESSTETAAKREAREQIYARRFEAESKKFLEEIRKQAMIEYK